MRIDFSIPGRPRAKERHRQGQGRSYSSDELVAETVHIRKIARKAIEALGVTPLTGPVRMIVEGVFETPASWNREAKAAALAGDVPHISVPDLDNIEKLIADACNEVVYVDDSQIAEKISRKRYGSGARVDVAFEPIINPFLSNYGHPGEASKIERLRAGPKKKARRKARPAEKPSNDIGKRIK